jgi:RNA polymerase sigma factor (sigma-70 family)
VIEVTNENIDDLAIKAKSCKAHFDALYMHSVKYMSNSYRKALGYQYTVYNVELLLDMQSELYFQLERAVANFDKEKANWLSYIQYWFLNCRITTQAKFKNDINAHFRRKGYDNVSRDEVLLIDDEGDHISKYQGKCDNLTIEQEKKEDNQFLLNKLLSCLNPLEKEVYTLYYQEELTIKEIKEKLNLTVTIERIRQIRKSAEKKLKKYKK